MKCEDCDYSDIADWVVQDEKIGKATPIYWCEKHKHLCDDIQDCELKGKQNELQKNNNNRSNRNP